MSRARRVVVVTYDDFQLLDVTGPIEVLHQANRIVGRRNRAARSEGYRCELVTLDGQPARSTSGVVLHADRALRAVRGDVDTLMIAGGHGVRAALENRRLLEAVERLGRRARRVASVCTGAFLLAELGWLEGRRATTHWVACEAFAKRYPAVRVEADSIFVHDGVYTSAGVMAGMDLTLALVQEDYGAAAARDVARSLVLAYRREGGQSQFSVQLEAVVPERRELRSLQTYIRDHLAEPLSVPRLAREVGMSPRNFARIFSKETGVTPAAYVERERVSAARALLEGTTSSLEEVAGATGFGSAEVMRRAFQRQLQVTPGAYRERFRATEAERERVA